MFFKTQQLCFDATALAREKTFVWALTWHDEVVVYIEMLCWKKGWGGLRIIQVNEKARQVMWGPGTIKIV